MTKNGSQNSCNMIAKKNEQLHKKRRTEYLKAYMKKARVSLMQSLEQSESVELRKVIDELFSNDLNEEKNQKQNEQRKMVKIMKLINFANKGSNVAVMGISQLLLNKIINVEIIQDCYFDQQHENGKITSKEIKKKEIMEIIKFPTKNNDGWLALIRVLLTLGYCTQEMISYCINAIVKSRSINGLDLSLETLYILIIEKKIVSIEQIYTIIIKSTQKQVEQRPIRTEQLIYALMKHSLDSVSVKQCSNIRYYSTKLLTKSFQTQSILQDLILKLIPLQRIADYIKQKFDITTFYDKNKALKMLSSLLICLSNYNHYEPSVIISALSAPIIPILNYVKKLSYDIDLAHSLSQNKQSQLRYNHQTESKENFNFLQEAIFVIQILIDNYLFCTQSFDLIITSLEAFILEHILIYLHSAYYKEIKPNFIHQENCFSQYQDEGLTLQDMCKSLLIQKVTQLTQKIISNLLNLSSQIRNGNLQTSSQNIEKFLLIRNLIISRFIKSELQIIAERQIDLSGINLDYI